MKVSSDTPNSLVNPWLSLQSRQLVKVFTYLLTYFNIYKTVFSLFSCWPDNEIILWYFDVWLFIHCHEVKYLNYLMSPNRRVQWYYRLLLLHFVFSAKLQGLSIKILLWLKGNVTHKNATYNIWHVIFGYKGIKVMVWVFCCGVVWGT